LTLLQLLSPIVLFRFFRHNLFSVELIESIAVSVENTIWGPMSTSDTTGSVFVP
jgi:hypothetical protein